MPQILDIYPCTIINLVLCLYRHGLQAATHLGLLTIDYLFDKVFLEKGRDQNTAYHQLTTWTNCVPVSIRIKHVQCFCRALLWPIKNNPVCETEKNQSCNQKLLDWARPTASRDLECSGLGPLTINKIDD